MNIKITDSEFSRLIKFMHKTYGIDLSRKRILIEGRLSNVLTQKGFTNYTDYLNFVFSDKSGKETVTLVNKLTTNHTYFLREPQHFEFMQKVFLPYIEKTVKDHDVRIWCAASSSGEEPYTIAMIIDDYFGSRKAGWDLRILATDISTNVLQKAKNAVYPAESIKNVPQRWREKYFIKNSDGTYTITDRIKR